VEHSILSLSHMINYNKKNGGVQLGGVKKSRTGKDSFIEERIFGGHHYKTTIYDGQHKVEGRGRTAEETEKTASEKWEDECGDDEDED